MEGVVVPVMVGRLISDVVKVCAYVYKLGHTSTHIHTQNKLVKYLTDIPQL